MRETLDCAVLLTPDHTSWVQEWIESHRGQFGRLRLYAKDYTSLVSLTADAPVDPPLALAMRRFDGCILPVAQGSLSWTRTMLAHANATPGVPMIGLLFDLSAPAILDLMSLGVTDFVRAPACPEELRARIVCRNRGKPRSQRTGLDTCEPNPSVLHGRAPLAGYSPSVLVRPRDVATPGPRNVDRLPGALPGVPRSSEAADLAIDAEAFDVRSTDEPFRQAKARIVAGFESAYLRRALSRYSGNVAQAARASCKHRRAFWALMRKHQIDAAHYRIDETFREPSA